MALTPNIVIASDRAEKTGFVIRIVVKAERIVTIAKNQNKNASAVTAVFLYKCATYTKAAVNIVLNKAQGSIVFHPKSINWS